MADAARLLVPVASLSRALSHVPPPLRGHRVGDVGPYSDRCGGGRAAPLLYSSTSLVLHAVDALRLYSTYIGGATPLLGIAARVAVYSRCARSGDLSSTRPYPYLY